jgi:hypothetical protein
MWTSCYLERPALGAHVLVALNPNGDTLVVPLTPSYGERLRQLRPPRPPASPPAPAQPPSAAPQPPSAAPQPPVEAPQTGEHPFHY